MPAISLESFKFDKKYDTRTTAECDGDSRSSIDCFTHNFQPSDPRHNIELPAFLHESPSDDCEEKRGKLDFRERL